MSDDILELEIQPSYIGSAYTPQVEVSETSGGHNVAITYDDAESGITTVDFDVLDGEQGPQGETGAAAGFGTVSATVDNATGTPSVEVTTSGDDTAKNFAFAFHNLKGAQGEPGDVQADSVYPMLHAGLADALSSSYGETATFAQRTSTRSGAVEIDSVLGNTVVWNQLANIPTVSLFDVRGGTFTVSDGVIEYTPNSGTSTNYYARALISKSAFMAGLPTGHKALIAADMKYDYVHTLPLAINGCTQTSHNGYTNTGNWQRVWAFYTNSSGGTRREMQFFFENWNGSGGTIAEGAKGYLKNIECFDLTAMFGAGNEPSTVAEFEAQYPDAYYPYDAGSLKSVNIAGITSAGSTREIPASTYFPQGMRGAGSAHDELTKDSAVTRIGAVDLGTLEWGNVTTVNTDTYGYRKSVIYTPIMPSGDNTRIANVVCTKYEAQTNNNTYLANSGISVDGTQHRIYIYDPSYNQLDDIEAFTTAVSGVMLYYELATPTTQTIDPPLNLTYPVEAGGTESIIVPTGATSAAPTFVTLYAYDADGIIDKTQSIIAQVEGGVASTNYAVNSYLVMRGTLYRVTSAIATGEIITPGTNCTATTVMAEIVRLTA